MEKTITIAHSPDADDAFMFYALAKGKVGRPGYRFEHAMNDIESLNRLAAEGRHEVTAISYHAYAYLQDRYRILSVGSSLGEGVGPLVVALESSPAAPGGDGPESLTGKRVAIPGERTTAHLLARLYQADFEAVIVDFDRVTQTLRDGGADFGVIIHEGQVTYGDLGLRKVVDLGEWWKEETGLPVPLGANAVRRDLPEDEARLVGDVIRESIRYALDHREEALEYALGFGRGVDHDRGDLFVGMYVNDYTIDLGPTGTEAVRALLGRAHACGIIPVEPALDIL